MNLNNAKFGLLLGTVLSVGACQPRTVQAAGPSASPNTEDEDDDDETIVNPMPEAGDGGSDGDAVPANEGGGIQLKGTWSLEERAIWEQIYADRTQYLNLMNTACGSSIEMTFDHEAFRDRLPSVKTDRNEDWSASPMINEIRNLCLKGATQKTAVATRIAKIKFVRTPGKKHALRGKKLVIALDLDANPREHVNNFAAWLPESL